MTDFEKTGDNQPSSPYPSYPSSYGGYPTPVERPGNGLAIASLVCGIVGLLIFGVILGPLAIIFGGVGLNRANKGAKYKGLAIAGLILGVIAVVAAIVILAVYANNGVFG